MFCSLSNFRLHGINSALIKIERDADNINETISNNILLDVVNTKRTNVIVSSYAIILFNSCEPMHIYCGEDHIFMKSQSIEHRIKLNGVKGLQSNLSMM